MIVIKKKNSVYEHPNQEDEWDKSDWQGRGEKKKIKITR